MTDDSFTQAILSLRETLYRISYGLLSQEQDRLDAVQEALARAWEKRSTLREDAYVKTWVIRILINTCHTIRRRKRDIPVESLPQRPVPEGAEQAVHDALLALPEKLRLPVMLHYMEGYAIGEIAAMLRLPMGTVATRMRRARLLLRKWLTDEEVHLNG